MLLIGQSNRFTTLLLFTLYVIHFLIISVKATSFPRHSNRINTVFSVLVIRWSCRFYLQPNARFQITVLVRFGSVWFWLVTVLLIVWPRSLLLRPFHKLRIWWKKSVSFCQTDSPRFSCTMYCYRYPQLTRKNLEVSELSSLSKSTKRKSLVILTWEFP